MSFRLATLLKTRVRDYSPNYGEHTPVWGLSALSPEPSALSPTASHETELQLRVLLIMLSMMRLMLSDVLIHCRS